jgi:ATP-binding cassette, subfamily B, bacterial PglK
MNGLPDARRGSAKRRGSGVVAAVRDATRLLDGRERLRFALLVGLLPISALGEMAAVAAMLPFLGALTARDPASALPSTALWLERIGIVGRGDLLPLLGAAACLILVVTNALIVVSSWLVLRFSWSLHHRLATTLLRQYLHKPYAHFLSKNSAALASSLILQVGQVTDGFFVPVLTALGRMAAALTLILFLGISEPLLALVAVGLIGGIYSVFYLWMARRKLRDLGARRVRLNTARTQLINEAFGGIKDIKLLQAEETFVDAYGPLSRALSRDQVTAVLMAVAPRYVVEAVAFGTVVLVALLAGAGGPEHGHLVPMLGMFAFAGYRLMPAVQHVFASAVQIRTNLPAFQRLYQDIHAQRGAGPASHAAAPGEQRSAEQRSGKQPAPGQAPSAHAALAARQRIELRDVTFRYPGASNAALTGFNLVLEARSTIGIVGSTGSGKTTVLDLLLGLLRPEQGALLVDGEAVDAADLPRWQRTLGYVPQHIYLSDSSIARNVAFGVPEAQINQERVEEACRVAQIHDFICESLPDGYATTVGERGVRLSGGERQRIGIARALYRCPDVLILDEATSALDTATEENVIAALQRFAGQKTIVMVAHRESTLRQCDVIYRISRGRIELIGSHAALLGQATSPSAGAAVPHLVPLAAK